MANKRHEDWRNLPFENLKLAVDIKTFAIMRDLDIFDLTNL